MDVVGQVRRDFRDIPQPSNDRNDTQAIESMDRRETGRGSHRAKNATLKAFRPYPTEDLTEADKVRQTIRVNVVFNSRSPS